MPMGDPNPGFVGAKNFRNRESGTMGNNSGMNSIGIKEDFGDYPGENQYDWD